MDNGPDFIAGIGVVGSLDIAGKGVLTGGGGNGTVRTGRSGSVLTRRRRLCVSAGLDCGACERPAASAEGLTNGCRAGSAEERASGRTRRFG